MEILPCLIHAAVGKRRHVVPLNHRREHFAVAEPGKHLVAVAALLALKQEIILGDFLGEIIQAARAGDIANGRKQDGQRGDALLTINRLEGGTVAGRRGGNVQTSGPRK